MTLNQHKNRKLRHNREFEERETIGKLINRIPGSRLLISSLPGSALRTHVESLVKPRDVNKRSQSLAWFLPSSFCGKVLFINILWIILFSSMSTPNNTSSIYGIEHIITKLTGNQF